MALICWLSVIFRDILSIQLFFPEYEVIFLVDLLNWKWTDKLTHEFQRSLSSSKTIFVCMLRRFLLICWFTKLIITDQKKAQILPRASEIPCWYVDWKLKQSVEKLVNALIFLLICWFTILPNTDRELSSNFPGVVRRSPLICWFTILNILPKN